MMKIMLLFALLIMVFFTGCAKIQVADENYENYQIAEFRTNLPKDAVVKVIDFKWDGVQIGIKNVVVLFVEVCNETDCQVVRTAITADGWITFMLPEGHWFDFVFKSHADDLWHYVYVTRSNEAMPMDFMDKSIVVYLPGRGRCAAMTARKFELGK